MNSEGTDNLVHVQYVFRCYPSLEGAPPFLSIQQALNTIKYVKYMFIL